MLKETVEIKVDYEKAGVSAKAAHLCLIAITTHSLRK